MTSHADILAQNGVKSTRCGLRFTRVLSEAELIEVGKTVMDMSETITTTINFSIGDWYNQLSSYGNATKIVAEYFGGLTVGHVKNCGSVAAAFELSSRDDNYPWWCYRALAPLVGVDDAYVKRWLTAKPGSFNETTLLADKRYHLMPAPTLHLNEETEPESGEMGMVTLPVKSSHTAMSASDPFIYDTQADVEEEPSIQLYPPDSEAEKAVWIGVEWYGKLVSLVESHNKRFPLARATVKSFVEGWVDRAYSHRIGG